LIVAEVAQAHDGSLGAAHAYIDAVARTGADGIKFQTHIADAESTPDEQFRVRFSRRDKTRYDYWKRMEFSAEEWRGLSEHAKERGLLFLSSAFSLEAVDLLDDLGMVAWKVGSGEVTTTPLLERMAKTGRPVLLSSGMSSWEELDRAVEIVRGAGAPCAVFQCTSAYPCPAESIGLNVIAELKERYGCPAGLSDHSGTPYPALAAVALGANLIELHVVFSRDCFGPDTPASVTVDELTQLVQGIRFIERALANPIDKQAMARDLAPLKQLFEKSVVALSDLPQGHLLRREDLGAKKPGTGIPASRIGEIVGKRLRRPLSRNALVQREDLE
jgi:N-acetylneuraminate synthase